ncbi:MAG TPA: iron-containing redox enzyme family protein [Solirubrobacteraceae bacterium]|nr:iron-containing redox enzyme family protein [Solirubrobacteraceae bacterium]
MDVIARLDQARAEINVLEHPFYQRWSAGELSAAELARYAGEYQHAVLALARASAQAADSAAEQAASSPVAAAHRAGLLAHAQEEAAHVQLWGQFQQAAAAACAPADAHVPAHTPTPADTCAVAPAGGEPLAQTRACARAWEAGHDLLERLAVLYAIEASQPEISATKLAGLSAHYGYSAEGPASEYFRVHEQRDVEHARAARELIAALMAESDGDDAAERMLACARAALRGNWLLLDGVEALSAAA